MTQFPEMAGAQPRRGGGLGQPAPPQPPRPPQRRFAGGNPRPWWRRPWIVPLGLIVIAFIGYSVSPYLTFDPAQSRVPPDFGLHYALVVGHVLFGTVAILTVCLQVWPWLRVRHPVVHRWSGRLYVFGGVLPSAICALLIMPVSAGPFGNAVAGVLWLATTFTGYRMARKRRWAEHRRFMIYAFALTMQVIWARILFLGAPLVTTIDLNDQFILLETTTWLGFVINIVAAQLWLDYTARKRQRSRVTRAGTQQPPVRTAA